MFRAMLFFNEWWAQGEGKTPEEALAMMTTPDGIGMANLSLTYKPADMTVYCDSPGRKCPHIPCGVIVKL